MESEIALEKLYQFYGVSSVNDLAEKMKVSRQTITNWKARNSINAIKKKCRELGIYNDIFGDIVINQINQGDDGRAGNRDYIENSTDHTFDELTISLINKCIDKYGEENFQFKLMDLLKSGL
jgi:hypothetical protein